MTDAEKAYEGTEYEGAQIVIELLEKKYLWEEPPQRRARSMLKRINAVWARMPTQGIEEGPVEPDVLGSMLDSVDMALDFFYAYHPEMAADKIKLDTKAKEKDIIRAFGEVSAFVLIPFEKEGLVK